MARVTELDVDEEPLARREVRWGRTGEDADVDVLGSRCSVLRRDLADKVSSSGRGVGRDPAGEEGRVRVRKVNAVDAGADLGHRGLANAGLREQRVGAGRESRWAARGNSSAARSDGWGDNRNDEWGSVDGRKDLRLGRDTRLDRDLDRVAGDRGDFRTRRSARYESERIRVGRRSHDLGGDGDTGDGCGGERAGRAGLNDAAEKVNEHALVRIDELGRKIAISH